MSEAMFDVRALFAGSRRPAAAPGPYARGLAALGAGLPAEALAEFEAAAATAASGRERSAAQNKSGVALIALGRRQEAFAAFTAALESEARNAAALVNVGNLLLEDGRPSEALEYYRAASAADEAYPLAHRNRAIALKALGRRAEAVSALRTAARLESRRCPPRG